MFSNNSMSIISKMRGLAVCCILAAMVTAEEYAETLTVSKPQADRLAKEVCSTLFLHTDQNKLQQCKDRFQESLASGDRAPEARIRSHIENTLVVQVPPSEHTLLVVMVPKNNNSILFHRILKPNDTIAKIRSSGMRSPRVWTAYLTPAGRPGLWTVGPTVAKWNRVTEKPYIVKMNRFYMDVEHGRGAKYVATFSWNRSDSEDILFSVNNDCQKYEMGTTFQIHIDMSKEEIENDSVTIPGLSLNDNCTITVRGNNGEGKLNYATPSCFDGKCAPEIPHITRLHCTPAARGRGWDVRVTWARPAHAPVQYNVTVQAGTNHTVTVPGNSTEAVVRNVIGHLGYKVTLVAIAKNNGVTNRRDLFPTIASASLGVALASAWCAALAVGVVAAGGCIWLRRRRRAALNNIYSRDLERKVPKEYLMDGFPADTLIARDHWEVLPDVLLLHEVIGEGAFGVVRRGTLAPGAREVAVKMLKDCPSVEEMRSFRGEMELMKSVGAHAHVVSLVGCCSQKRLMIVAEYCSRGDLLNYLRCAWSIMVSKRNAKYYNNNIEYASDYRNDLFKCNPQKDSKLVVNRMYDLQGVCDAELSLVDLLSFCRQIAMGMEFLTANRVVHRDLAARNVLVTGDKTLKIADFGLSRDVYQDNQYRQKGTGKMPIKWMALESLSHRIYTSQSDVWSFGVVIWEVLTIGGSPYPGISANQIQGLLKSGYRMPRPNNCSKQLYALVVSCWRARARDRPSFAQLHRQLDALLNCACAEQYLALDLEGDDDAPAPRPPKYLGLIPRGKRYWTGKLDRYERPLQATQTQSNHYTLPPDSAVRTQVASN